MVDTNDWKLINAIMIQNGTWLANFMNSIAHLSRKTWNGHYDRVEFFLCEYLTNRNGLTMEEGIDYVGDFMGKFCPENGVCTSPAQAQSMAVSVKKFYRAMASQGAIPEEDYARLTELIRASLPEWKAAAAAANRTIPNAMVERRRMIENAPVMSYRKGEGWVELDW